MGSKDNELEESIYNERRECKHERRKIEGKEGQSQKMKGSCCFTIEGPGCVYMLSDVRCVPGIKVGIGNV